MVMLLLSGLSGTVGCGWLGDCLQEPKVERFYASSMSVEHGGIVYLAWETLYEDSCEIWARNASDELYAVLIWKDTYGVDHPLEQTTYWLVCENSCGGKGYATTTVSVSAP